MEALVVLTRSLCSAIIRVRGGCRAGQAKRQMHRGQRHIVRRLQ